MVTPQSRHYVEHSKLILRPTPVARSTSVSSRTRTQPKPSLVQDYTHPTISMSGQARPLCHEEILFHLSQAPSGQAYLSSWLALARDFTDDTKRQSVSQGISSLCFTSCSMLLANGVFARFLCESSDFTPRLRFVFGRVSGELDGKPVWMPVW